MMSPLSFQLLVFRYRGCVYQTCTQCDSNSIQCSHTDIPIYQKDTASSAVRHKGNCPPATYSLPKHLANHAAVIFRTTTQHASPQNARRAVAI
jgi:hypothetical protein